MSATKPVWLVDAEGTTQVFTDETAARRWVARVDEISNHAWLTITEAAAPAQLEGRELYAWCIANVPPDIDGAP